VPGVPVEYDAGIKSPVWELGLEDPVALSRR
jgi:hypothetical protein